MAINFNDTHEPSALMIPDDEGGFLQVVDEPVRKYLNESLPENFNFAGSNSQGGPANQALALKSDYGTNVEFINSTGVASSDISTFVCYNSDRNLQTMAADVAGDFIGKVRSATKADSATTANTATYSDYLNIVQNNEIRLNLNGSTNASSIWFNWGWSDSADRDTRVGSYSFGDGSGTGTLAGLVASHIYAISLGRATLWSGTWSSGTLIIPNARKYSTIILYGKPASDESNCSYVFSPGLTGNAQFCSNIAYFTFRIEPSGEYDTKLTMKTNPDGGSLIQISGVTQYRA